MRFENVREQAITSYYEFPIPSNFNKETSPKGGFMQREDSILGRRVVLIFHASHCLII